MAHHPQNRGAATAAQSSVSPALLGALALLAVGLLLVLLGPQMLSYLNTEQAPHALAVGAALLGTAAMISALALLARNIERHAFASLAPVLTAFSGCVMWALDAELSSVHLPLKHLGLLGLVASAIAAAAIARGALSMRVIGWVVCLFTPGSLVSLLWADSGSASLLEAFAASDSRTRLFVGMAFATSLLLALFAEATRGLSPNRALAQPTAAPRRAPAPTYPSQATTQAPSMMAYAATQSPVAAPAPSLPPSTQRVLQLAPVDDDEDFHAMLRPRRRWTKVSGMAFVGAAAAVGTFFIVRSLSGPTATEANVSETPADDVAPAATESEVAAGAPMAPEPREPETTAELKPTVEAMDTDGVPTDEEPEAPPPSETTSVADSEATAEQMQAPVTGDEPASPESEASAAGENAPTPPEVASTTNPPAKAARAPKAARKARARARRAPKAKTKPSRAKRAAARRARPRRAAARRTRAQAAARKPAAKPKRRKTKPKTKPKAKPKPQKASPNDSIEELMKGAVRNNGANDPIFGL